MRSTIRTYYELLGLSPSASSTEIKTAFRRSAQLSHPDHNDSAPSAAAQFRLLRNAYETLVDTARRLSYDRYLQSTAARAARRGAGYGPAASQSRRIGTSADSLQDVLAHLSAVFWDIEDLVRGGPDLKLGFGGATVGDHLLKILSFVDRWVLSPSGFGDHFYEARNMSSPGRTGTVFMDSTPGHGPYVNLEDYFYAIRRRVDRFLGRVTLLDLTRQVEGHPVTVLDGILEAYNLAVHYVGHLRTGLSGGPDRMPEFRHSHPCYAE